MSQESFRSLFIRDKTPKELTTTMEVWTVEWRSRYGEYSTNLKAEHEAFTDKEEAIEFKEALEYAFKLLRHTSNTEVTICSNK